MRKNIQEEVALMMPLHRITKLVLSNQTGS
jgi:hypothetical protein